MYVVYVIWYNMALQFFTKINIYSYKPNALSFGCLLNEFECLVYQKKKKKIERLERFEYIKLS